MPETEMALGVLVRRLGGGGLAMIEGLRRGIPTFMCIEGCHDCCGPVPTVAAERAQMGAPPVEAVTGYCPYLIAEGCSCYEERPLMCRLFGVTPDLPCPHGCAPAVMMTPASTRALLADYRAMGGVEFVEV